MLQQERHAWHVADGTSGEQPTSPFHLVAGQAGIEKFARLDLALNDALIVGQHELDTYGIFAFIDGAEVVVIAIAPDSAVLSVRHARLRT